VYISEPARQIPVIAQPDVLVVGAGPAGIGAAIAAARNGAHVLLVERYGFLGGNLTTAMINPMFTFHDIHGKQVIQGIAGELVERLVEAGVSLGHVTDLTFDNASMTPFDPEGMKQQLLRMVQEAGVQLLLHTTIVDVVKLGSVLQAVITESKSGRQAICPKLIIDCSGDADIAALAGVPYVLGRSGDQAMQPVSLFFRIAGIDFARLRYWMKQNRDQLKEQPTDAEIDSQQALAFLGLNKKIQADTLAGEYPKDAAPRILFYQLPREGQVAVNVTRLQGINGTDVNDLTRAEIALRQQAWDVHRYLQTHVGGFETSYILDTGVQVGVRETRHIQGDYTLTEKDVLSGQAFEDGIACGTFAIDIHPPEGTQQIYTGSGKAVYEIPYRCLLPLGLDNLLVAGRSISVTHTAFGSVRVMATCMAIGQGAGTATAEIVQRGVTTRQVDIKSVRRRLIEQGQFLLDPSVEVTVNERLRLERAGGSGAQASHYNPFADTE
jgi:hypothetical protein